MIGNIGLPGLLLLLALLFTIVVPFFMARARGRSGILWFLIGIVGTPILAVLLLFALGPKTNEAT
jgi:uncharacterized SAM-binding protein YcdF (DUF218 family)